MSMHSTYRIRKRCQHFCSQHKSANDRDTKNQTNYYSTSSPVSSDNFTLFITIFWNKRWIKEDSFLMADSSPDEPLINITEIESFLNGGIQVFRCVLVMAFYWG